MFPYWRRGDFCAPIEGEVDRAEAYRGMPGRVLGSKGGEGRERLWEPGRGQVGIWWGAGNPEGGEASSLSAVGSDGGEAGLPGQAGGRGGIKIVRRPSLDSVPEAVHPSERDIIWGQEVGHISEYREEEATGNAMTKKGSDTSPCRGEAFDEGEDGLSQQKPMCVVVGSIEGGGEPVS